MHLIFSLILVVVFIIFDAFCFTPSTRAGQIANLIDTKIYFGLGIDDKQTILNDIFYLELNDSFDASYPSWVPLEGKEACFTTLYATSVAYNSIIYVIGGRAHNFADKNNKKNRTDNDNNKNSSNSSSSNNRTSIDNNNNLHETVYKFDSINLKWERGNFNNSALYLRQEIDAVVDEGTGKVYVFGGVSRGNPYNDMNILDLINNTWTSIKATSSYPSSRFDYTATLLRNGLIIYIGGIELKDNNTMFNIIEMKEVNIFYPFVYLFIVCSILLIVHFYLFGCLFNLGPNLQYKIFDLDKNG